jgi:DnaJ-class molecular chaperone
MNRRRHPEPCPTCKGACRLDIIDPLEKDRWVGRYSIPCPECNGTGILTAKTVNVHPLRQFNRSQRAIR